MRRWTIKDLQFIRQFIHIPDKMLAEYFKVPKTTIEGLRKRHRIMKGKDVGRFKKGNTPKNKGKTWDEWLSPEGQAVCRQTHFKKR